MGLTLTTVSLGSNIWQRTTAHGTSNKLSFKLFMYLLPVKILSVSSSGRRTGL